jgi:hypothetical protein
MALTKRNLSDLIRDIMSGGDPSTEGKLHPAIIWKTADTVFGAMIKEAQRKDRDNNGYDINGDWLSTFKNVEVKTDNDTGEQYSDLPAQVISLNQNRGIHRVSEMKNIDNAFAQVPAGSHDTYRILDVHYLNKKTEFYVSGNKIFYRNLGLRVEKVLIKMIAGIADLGADDPLPVPAVMEEEFINRTMAILQQEKDTPINIEYNGH